MRPLPGHTRLADDPVPRLNLSPRKRGQAPRVPKPEPLDEESAEYLNRFRFVCADKYKNLARAWQLLLDPDRVGRISFVPFHKAARTMGFFKVQQLWIAL